MKHLTFVPASPEDADLIFAQCKELVLRFEDPKEVELDYVLQWLQKKIRNHISQYTCVLCGDEKVAFFSLAEGENGMELDDLYVLEPYRNQGIGSQILAHCFESTNRSIYLYVFTANDGAIRFYLRRGFVITQQVSPTRCIMTRDLTQPVSLL